MTLKPLLLLAAFALVSCGGGSDPPPPEVAIHLAAMPGEQGYFGRFYEREGQVVADARVIATAQVNPGVPPGGRLLWELLEKPVGSTASLAPQDAITFSQSFIADRPGNYRLQLVADYHGVRSSPAFATVTAIRHHIEFVVEIGNDPGQTVVIVRSGVTRPLGRTLGTRPIASVEAVLDGNSLGVLTEPNQLMRFASGTRMAFEGIYVYWLDNAALGTGPHTLDVRLIDVEGLTRTGRLTLVAGVNAQESFSGY